MLVLRPNNKATGVRRFYSLSMRSWHLVPLNVIFTPLLPLQDKLLEKALGKSLVKRMPVALDSSETLRM